MTTEYPNFATLIANHRKGEDYEQFSMDRSNSETILLAPHGGRIEPHTDQIARDIAGTEFSYYCFVSHRRKGEANLHITSHNFDDPVCVDLLARHANAVAIHGCKGNAPEVLVGGLDSMLSAELAAALRAAGINVRTDDHKYLATHKLNICNRSATGAGVQLEITMPLRQGSEKAKLISAVRSVLLTKPRPNTSLERGRGG